MLLREIFLFAPALRPRVLGKTRYAERAHRTVRGAGAHRSFARRNERCAAGRRFDDGRHRPRRAGQARSSARRRAGVYGQRRHQRDGAASARGRSLYERITSKRGSAAVAGACVWITRDAPAPTIAGLAFPPERKLYNIPPGRLPEHAGNLHARLASPLRSELISRT